MRSYDECITGENGDEGSGGQDNYSSRLLTIENMEEIHGDASLFLAFFVLVIPDMVGRLRYKRFWSGSRERRYEELVSVADEGFGLELQRNVLVLCFLWQLQPVSTCLVLAAPGFITST